MKIELPKLPYELDALEPLISGRTLELHYRKHHQGYIAKLSNLIPGTRFENADLKTMIREAEDPILYNATQVWNHTFYFTGLRPERDYIINGPFADAIQHSFGSFSGMKDVFTKAANSFFGSGWIWLIINSHGLLEILQESDAENPLRKGMMPILACDVCEHAYYLDYQNNRSDYIESFWELIDWEIIEKRFCNIYVKNGLAPLRALYY